MHDEKQLPQPSTKEWESSDPSRVARIQVQEPLPRSDGYYRLLVQNLLEGVAHCRMLSTPHEAASDFLLLEVNRAFETETGLQAAGGQRLTELLPSIGQDKPDLFAMCARVAAGGPPEQLEIRLPALHRWLSLSAYSTIRGEFVLVAKNITSFKQSAEAIERHHAELKALYEDAPQMLCWVNEQFQIERMNRAMAAFLDQGDLPQPLLQAGGLPHCLSAYGCNSAHGQQCQHCQIHAALNETLAMGTPVRRQDGKLFLTHSGARREFRVAITSTPLSFGAHSRALLWLEDITARKELESQFLQAQKMQAIGQLTGGVVHDFNNILAATLLHLKILEERRDLAPEMITSLRELENRSQRAISLTRQLLQFSRQEQNDPAPVDLTELVAGLIIMLSRLLGENIEINFTPSAEPAWAIADAGMLEQLIVNLCVNARDAMPKGGRLTLGLDLTAQPPKPLEAAGTPPARFVRLKVSDTGCGMDETTQRRAFEPFFTTKEPGRGTGLGLSTVLNIARQHNGWAEITSAVRQGTTVTVFLPAVRPAPKTSADAPPVDLPTGTETILLVEDDRCVRQMVRATLHRFGYKLMEAADGIEALRLWAKRSERIDLLLTDMIMPGGISGVELAQYLRRSRPNLKVILTSGYSTALSRQAEFQSIHTRFLEKPYLQEMLINTVRDCLDGVPQDVSQEP